jgi:NAD(P)-dependent dehydrogenase (short-subunit alcohol dehydrogenase family)
LQDAASALGNPQNFLMVAGDIGQPQTARDLFARAIGEFGGVDILIANAGIFMAKAAVDFSEEDIDAMLAANVKGFLYPAQEAARHMTANGSGHIVATTACIALQPNVKLPCLMTAVTKGGLHHAVKALALELAGSGVQVNAVAPGVIDTPLLPRGEDNWAFFRTLAPNGKTGVPQDVVDAVLYLTGSSYVTGAVIPVDGGSTAGVW